MKKAGSGTVNQWYRSADPDPYQNVTSTTLLPSIQPMSRICKTQAEIITCCLSLFFSSFYLSVYLFNTVRLCLLLVLILCTLSQTCLSSPSVSYLSTFTVYVSVTHRPCLPSVLICYSPSVSLWSHCLPSFLICLSSVSTP
jgi:hypothetical protein